MENKKVTTLSVKLTPHDEDHNACEIHIAGTPNMLSNAFCAMSAAFLKRIKKEFGEPLTLALYSGIQLEALKQAGFEEDIEERRRELEEAGLLDCEEEEEEEEAKPDNYAARDALLSILGKTFEMPEQKEEAE